MRCGEIGAVEEGGEGIQDLETSSGPQGLITGPDWVSLSATSPFFTFPNPLNIESQKEGLPDVTRKHSNWTNERPREGKVVGNV